MDVTFAHAFSLSQADDSQWLMNNSLRKAACNLITENEKTLEYYWKMTKEGEVWRGSEDWGRGISTLRK